MSTHCDTPLPVCMMSLPVTPAAPLWVLQPSTVENLGVLLEQEKLLPSDSGHLRDWRGVAELSGLAADNILYQRISNSKLGHFNEIFKSWKLKQGANVRDLWTILADIDRFDVQDDMAEKVMEDIKLATKAAAIKGLKLEELKVTELALNRIKNEEDALTIEDLDCLNRGLPLPVYDAFILYGEDDADVVGEIVENLEAQGLKIIIKDRDLLGGTFEHSAVMKLIGSRCSKLIPFFTPTFFDSVYNKFLVDFAQFYNLETNKKIGGKIIPLVTDKHCDIPPNLSIYSKMKYAPNNKLFNFWERLVKTINPAVGYDESKLKSKGETEKSEAKVPEKKKETVSASAPSSVNKKRVEVPTKKKTNKQTKEESKLPEFTNVIFEREESVTESEYGDSGALLLPDVPDHEPGSIKGFFNGIKSKIKKGNKSKHKVTDPSSSSC